MSVPALKMPGASAETERADAVRRRLRLDGPAPDELTDNFLVRYWEAMSGEEAEALEHLAALDHLHGDEPTR